MQSSGSIEHIGVVKSVGKDVVAIELRKDFACQSCQIKSSCSIHEDDNKTIEISSFELSLVAGEPVRVILKRSSGRNALLLGYIFPFIVLFTAMAVAAKLSDNELVIGLSAVLALIPYYCVLYVFREKFKKEFKITIKKIHS